MMLIRFRELGTLNLSFYVKRILGFFMGYLKNWGEWVRELSRNLLVISWLFEEFWR